MPDREPKLRHNIQAKYETFKKGAKVASVAAVTLYVAFNLPSCGPTVIEDGNNAETGIVLNKGDFTVSRLGPNMMRVVPNPILYEPDPSDKWHTPEEIQAAVDNTMKEVENRVQTDLVLANCNPLNVRNATNADIPGMPKDGEQPHDKNNLSIVIWVADLRGKDEQPPYNPAAVTKGPSLSDICFDNVKELADN